MNLVLEQFDNIVTNVANSYRLQEECDVLSLVLSQHPGVVVFSFKAGAPQVLLRPHVRIVRSRRFTGCIGVGSETLANGWFHAGLLGTSYCSFDT